MPAANSITPDSRRSWIRLPRPLWIGLTASLLVLAAVGLHIGVPIYRQHIAIQAVERLGGQVSSLPRGPNWLRGWLVYPRWRMFHDVVGVRLDDTPADDATLARVECLSNLQELSLVNTRVTEDGLDELKRAMPVLKYAYR
jgi:hypothetical protein